MTEQEIVDLELDILNNCKKLPNAAYFFIDIVKQNAEDQLGHSKVFMKGSEENLVNAFCTTIENNRDFHDLFMLTAMNYFLSYPQKMEKFMTGYMANLKAMQADELRIQSL